MDEEKYQVVPSDGFSQASPWYTDSEEQAIADAKRILRDVPAFQFATIYQLQPEFRLVKEIKKAEAMR